MSQPPATASLVMLGLFVVLNAVVIGGLAGQMMRELGRPRPERTPETEERTARVFAVVDEFLPGDADSPMTPITGKYRQIYWIGTILAVDAWIIRTFWPWLL